MAKKLERLLMARAAESIRCDFECSAVPTDGGWYLFGSGSDHETIAYALRDYMMFADVLPFVLEFTEDGGKFRVVPR